MASDLRLNVYLSCRFPTARAVKSDTEMDFKNLVEQIVEGDFLLFILSPAAMQIAAYL